ncbi:hypothetical protein PAXRUDRAFT_21989 [Paxillus rubicundulus Ve08.2h10]|uniref:Uncharacterized protein n=1 Tax=Paxillus rubicundulus Ve08.2h10 TaxID=930991 RepID=A0A0D0CA60_9AGAM|nr:hypothetical protein PAXRUDRAFT_21989 [Paxillus rubicundulus Ve08.2h10]
MLLKVFCIKPGYLWQFHELMEDRDEEECFHVLNRLGEIFCNLQCLPTSVATSKKVVGKPWVIGKHGKVQFITNPTFYKILGLAESGVAIQQRAGPWAVKPTEEFSLDMELFGPEDTDILMQDVDGSEDGSIDMEDIIEEATRKEDRDMVMEDASSSEDEGRSDVLLEEESEEDSDYHMDEDSDMEEGQ